MRDPAPAEPLREARAACPYCGTGCGVLLQAQGDAIVGVRGDPDHPANFGRLCPKGQTLHLTATPQLIAQARLLQPTWRVRGGRAAGSTIHAAPPAGPLAWDAALAVAADRFADAIGRRGPDSVAFYVSGQLQTEDYYVFNKLARALAGTNNIDSNSRLCMSSAVVAYKRTLGADAPPCSYDDLALADCVLVAGANPAVAHPVLFGRLLEARRTRGTRLIVVDPRASETAQAADLHLAIAPGTDLYLLTALLGVLLRDGLVDAGFIAARTTGFDAAAAQARALPLEWAAVRCGVAPADIERAAHWFGRAPASLSLFCQGLNQSAHGSDNGAALIHLHLATGQIGRPGAGPFSLTGQPNAMGGRETGTMASLLPGHRDPADADDRAAVARHWGVPALPAAPGHTAVALFEAAARGEIECLWIACTNPAQSLPDQALVQAALARTPFVVLQEAYAHTETAAHADLLLPAATFGERTGTMTNSERRITLARAVVTPPGQARPDWRIAADFAQALAARIAPERGALFAWPDVAAVFDEYAALTTGRDLDIGALTHAILQRDGPQQWPCRAAAASGTARLYTDHQFATADGRARFAPLTLGGPAEACSERFPLALTTTRVRDQWHGASRTGLVAPLQLASPAAEVAPATLDALQLADDALVELRTARGSLVLPVRATAAQRAGTLAVSMHAGGRWLPGSAGINALTTRARDPLSQQPELKHAAAALTPVSFAWHFAALGWLPDDAAVAALEALRAAATALPYAALSIFGRGPRSRLGVQVVAAAAARDDALVACAQRVLGIDDHAASFRDARAGVARRLQLRDGTVVAAVLEGRRRSDIAARSTYQALIDDAVDCSRRPLQALFAPGRA